MANKLPPAAVPKWDWDLAFAMFCGGMNYDQIMAHAKFRGMPRSTLVSAASRQDWTGRKERLARLPQSNAVDNAAKALTDRLKTEGIKHQEFMLSQLERERSLFERKQKTQDGQADRLKILKDLDELGRRISKLDEQKEASPLTQNFQFLVHLQASTQRNGSEASAGILRSNNAHLEAVDTLENSPSGDIPADRAQPTLEEVMATMSPGELERLREESEPTVIMHGEVMKRMPAPSMLFGAAPIEPKQQP